MILKVCRYIKSNFWVLTELMFCVLLWRWKEANWQALNTRDLPGQLRLGKKLGEANGVSTFETSEMAVDINSQAMQLFQQHCGLPKKLVVFRILKNQRRICPYFNMSYLGPPSTAPFVVLLGRQGSLLLTACQVSLSGLSYLELATCSSLLPRICGSQRALGRTLQLSSSPMQFSKCRLSFLTRARCVFDAWHLRRARKWPVSRWRMVLQLKQRYTRDLGLRISYLSWTASQTGLKAGANFVRQTNNPNRM